MSTIQGGGKKIGFSLTSNKKGKKRDSKTTAKAAVEFADPEDEEDFENDVLNDDIPKKPLVIPCKKDSRESLQEQARGTREKETPDVVNSNGSSNRASDENNERLVKKEEISESSVVAKVNKAQLTDEDRAAIEALEREAAVAQGLGDSPNGIDKSTNKRVITSTGDTFQRQRDERDNDQKKFDADIDELPADISVKSQVYKTVPISEFGAAMLRGMGWNGGNDTNSEQKQGLNNTTMPRPSRLGLGATPKMLRSGDAPDTHSRRRPRRHDQFQRDEQRKRQQDEMEKERLRQLSMDKQKVLQLGSIVYVYDVDGENPRSGPRRAIIKKLTGVPGLNMISVQYEGDNASSKTKKGSVELVKRTDLNRRPFRYTEEKSRNVSSEDLPRTKNEDWNHRDYEREELHKRLKNHDRNRDRNRDMERENGRDRDRRREKERDTRYNYRDMDIGHELERDDERRYDEGKKRHKSEKSIESNKSVNGKRSSTVSVSWLIPNIRVRVISPKYGESVYKMKGVVVDVTRKGVAILNMGDGHIINVAERHLETALPKVGGRSIILSGEHRFSKGRLLERDSKKNCGVVQVFEDMSVVKTSLDDMAEWCGPLDDDLEY